MPVCSARILCTKVLIIPQMSERATMLKGLCWRSLMMSVATDAERCSYCRIWFKRMAVLCSKVWSHSSEAKLFVSSSTFRYSTSCVMICNNEAIKQDNGRVAKRFQGGPSGLRANIHLEKRVRAQWYHSNNHTYIHAYVHVCTFMYVCVHMHKHERTFCFVGCCCRKTCIHTPTHMKEAASAIRARIEAWAYLGASHV